MTAPDGPHLDDRVHSFEPYNRHELGETSDAEYFAALGTFLGLESDEAARRAHLWVLGEPYSHCKELVEELKSAGIRTGCLSNTERLHWERMTSDFYPAIQALEVKGASHLLKARKPDRAIFEAFEAFSGFERNATVYFDDTSVHVEGATAFGWRAALVDPSGDTASQMRRALADWGVQTK
jgi:HAD superfamily hydrolase (TIGR01509 family)